MRPRAHGKMNPGTPLPSEMAAIRCLVGTVAHAVILGLVMTMAACQGGGVTRPVAVESAEAAGIPALVETLAKRRTELASELVWAGAGQRRLALRDRAAPDMEIDILGPHRAGQNNLDLLIPDAHGKATSIVKLGFTEPDSTHRGYWMDDAGKTPAGMPEDDDDGINPSVNRVMSLVEIVYLTIWGRPVDYVLLYDRSSS
jgi:hypothetical protein